MKNIEQQNSRAETKLDSVQYFSIIRIKSWGCLEISTMNKILTGPENNNF